MRIYIAEDDPSVIGVLEDILESSALGRVCGASEEGAPDPERIMALDPDLVLVDLLMPGRDGIQLVRELKELGSRAKFVMISQVSAKELIAKAYQAGVEFFIQKPINLIEVRQVVGNVIRQMENERALHPDLRGRLLSLQQEEAQLHDVPGPLLPCHAQLAQDVLDAPAPHLLPPRRSGGLGLPALKHALDGVEGPLRSGWAPCAANSVTAPRPWSSGSGGRWSGGWATSPAWGWRTMGTSSSPSMPRCSSPFPRCGLRWHICGEKGDAAR